MSIRTKSVFASVMFALTLTGASCSPEAGPNDVGTIQQAGTWAPEDTTIRLFPSGDGLSLSGTGAGCGTAYKLLESSSGLCTPDGKYSEGCDVCCDVSVDSLCASASTAEDYYARQLDIALAAAGMPENAAGVSGLVSLVADYIQRISSSQSDRDRACNTHLKMQAIYERTASAVGTPKSFRIKFNTGNTYADLSLRTALISQRQAMRLTYHVCLDPSFGSK